MLFDWQTRIAYHGSLCNHEDADPRLAKHSRAVKLLTAMFKNNELTETEIPAVVWNSHEAFRAHRLPAVWEVV